MFAAETNRQFSRHLYPPPNQTMEYYFTTIFEYILNNLIQVLRFLRFFSLRHLLYQNRKYIFHGLWSGLCPKRQQKKNSRIKKLDASIWSVRAPCTKFSINSSELLLVTSSTPSHRCDVRNQHIDYSINNSVVDQHKPRAVQLTCNLYS